MNEMGGIYGIREREDKMGLDSCESKMGFV